MSLGLDEADRVGVVGLNGAGKTTLLRLLAGPRSPTTGRVTHRRDLRVASLPQALDLPPDATVRDVVIGAAWLPAGFAAEHEWAGDAGVRTVLDGLGLPRLGLDAPVGPMSGGERRRVALAALLVRASDVLVLDEPTNHLDLAGVRWLAEHLLRRRGALVVVTHDRWFLDAVCTATWEVGDGTVRAYEGGYAAWVLARAERERVAAATEARRQNLLRKEIAWLRRGPPARTSKPKFRIDAANALIADVPPPRDTVSLHRLATARLGKQVYELSDVSVSLRRRGRSWPAWTGWSGPGDRIGLLGANGAGKTTLLRLLAGVPSRRTPAGCGVGLDGAAGVPVPGAGRAAADRCGCWRRSRRWPGGSCSASGRCPRRSSPRCSASPTVDCGRSVGDLSGGERRRLQLLRLLAGRAQRAAARRADQRPRHRHAGRAGGPARLVAGHARRGQPRPVPGGAGLRPDDRHVRRRPAAGPARRGRRVPGAARRPDVAGARPGGRAAGAGRLAGRREGAGPAGTRWSTG